jgi:CDGSH-type Zn-finger protein/ferredoxin
MSEQGKSRPTIHVTENGPYMVEGVSEVRDARGESRAVEGKAFLCRCGRSSNKPFCDGTHNKVGFDGTETADAGPIAERREGYEADEVTILDDRSVCAHAGACTDGLPTVFKLGEEPWIEPDGAPAAAVEETVRGCPSGALAYTEPGADGPVEESLDPGIKAAVDGPYWLRGGIQVISVGGEPYEIRNRQTLCRCGGSGNKPFCDGTHWKGFKDPAEEE